MPRCTRKGCGAEYTSNTVEICTYHPGVPVFHEGLKSWSCCQDINKPELEFDEFMKISGCTEVEGHTNEKPLAIPSSKATPAQDLSTTITSDGKESFQIGGIPQPMPVPSSSSVPVVAPPPILELDDLNKPVAYGTSCRRKGCGTTFVSDEVNRQGDGEGTVCHYHPLPPIFREGSKGYLCCKRKVLEFDEFMKIKGCKIGRHVFVPVITEPTSEEQVNCRIDYYQTLNQVHVSIFAKQVDKDRSSVLLDESKITVDLYLPGMRRFTRNVDLFGSIDPSMSSFQIMGTKVELHLQKSDTRSWTVLEKTDRDLGNINLTFGVGGKTGTVGAKDVILDASNRART
ncbi:chord-domain-containing protein [Crassisporium funariophilum]|nr:chord-domain-containing protein [Crassisporium funariophilum]